MTQISHGGAGRFRQSDGFVSDAACLLAVLYSSVQDKKNCTIMRGRREHIAVRSYWGSPGGSLGGGNITHRRVDSVLVEHHWGLSDAGVHRPHLPSCLSACPPAAKFRHAGFRGRSSWGPGPGGDWAGPAQPRRRFEAPPRLAWLAPGRCTDWDAGWGPAGRAAATTTSATLAARFKGGSKVNAGGGGGVGLLSGTTPRACSGVADGLALHMMHGCSSVAGMGPRKPMPSNQHQHLAALWRCG